MRSDVIRLNTIYIQKIGTNILKRQSIAIDPMLGCESVMVPPLKCFAGSIFRVFIFLCLKELVMGFSGTDQSNEQSDAFANKENDENILAGVMVRGVGGAGSGGDDILEVGECFRRWISLR